MSALKLAENIAAEEAQRAYEAVLASGASSAEASDCAADAYERERRFALRDLYGEDFRDD